MKGRRGCATKLRFSAKMDEKFGAAIQAVFDGMQFTKCGYDKPKEISHDSPVSEMLNTSPVDHPTPSVTSDAQSLDLKQIDQTIERIEEDAFEG